MRLFDTHAHLDLPPFGDEAERLDVVDRAIRAGIRDILIPGVDPGGWRHLLGVASALAAKRSSVRIHTSIGIHPRAEGDLNRDPEAAVLDRLRAAIATRPVGLVALGECGLDFGARGRHVPRERQVAVFKAHLTLARETGLPLILHCVRAHDE
ncbi:MAG: TatD family hydrolase, partial [Myxococcales bacterium]|nr:TatD family hydrolase [Myxococcales bacterium]